MTRDVQPGPVLGGESLTLSANVVRWRHDFLHIAWNQENIDDEMRVVQLVFGRADAWMHWANFDPDRPVASLVRVLDSIRGLFRPPERSVRGSGDARSGSGQLDRGRVDLANQDPSDGKLKVKL